MLYTRACYLWPCFSPHTVLSLPAGRAAGRACKVPHVRRPSSCSPQPGSDSYDAVLLLGGGLLPDGGLPQSVRARLDLARELAALPGQDQTGSEQEEAFSPIVCLGSGTPHKPAVLTRTGHVLHEASACAEHLAMQGVARERIFRETASYDTIGNAYFACTMHAIPAGWRRMGVVTSAFHMPRTQSIFAHIFLRAGEALWSNPAHFCLDFHAAPDGDAYAADVMTSRKQREAQSLQDWERNAQSLLTLADIQCWLHTTHLCYAVARQGEFGTAAADDAKHTKAITSY